MSIVLLALVVATRIEPITSPLSGVRSNLVSYATEYGGGSGYRNQPAEWRRFYRPPRVLNGIHPHVITIFSRYNIRRFTTKLHPDNCSGWLELHQRQRLPKHFNNSCLYLDCDMERETGIKPAWLPWQSSVLSLNYFRIFTRCIEWISPALPLSYLPIRARLDSN